jgi:hypothetical protein
VEIDFEQDLAVEDIGGDSDSGTVGSAAAGGDSEADVFSRHDDITGTGGGHSNVSLKFNSDDGAGNTVAFTETDTVGETLHDTDGGVALRSLDFSRASVP